MIHEWNINHVPGEMKLKTVVIFVGLMYNFVTFTYFGNIMTAKQSTKTKTIVGFLSEE